MPSTKRPTKKAIMRRLIAFLNKGAERRADINTAKEEGVSVAAARRLRNKRRRLGHEAFDSGGDND